MFTFNGTHASTYGVKVVMVDRSPLPNVDNTLLDVPNRNGAYFVRTRLGVREIKATVKVIGASESELRSNVRAIGAWLRTKQPAPLVFDDEPSLQYMAIADGASIDEVLRVGEGDITFVCPTPYAIETTTNTQTLTPDATTNFAVGGNAPTYPVVTVTFTGSATDVVYSNDNGGVTYLVHVTGTFVTGDVLVIDHSKGYVTLNDSNAMPMLTLDSEFFALESGTEYIHLDPLTATVDISFNNRWL